MLKFLYFSRYMNPVATRIEEVLSFFDSNDLDLGYRRLLDCCIDTQNMEIYIEAIALTDWKYKNPDAKEDFITKAKELLAKTAEINISIANQEQDILETQNIEKSYGVNKFSLGPISLQIKRGQVYGLVGENGNGKTTLLRILAKELAADRGSITYHFTEKETPDYELRTQLIYIPQRTKTWYGSLKDNLKFVLSNYGVDPEENEIRVMMMIARFGLWEYKHLRWAELSSGYKMRFELARTLLRNPKLLLLDEPLANLDILSQQIILEDLRSMCTSINNPIALILSSQQLYEVEKVSDNVIYLKNGKYQSTQTANDANSNLNVPAPLIVEIETKTERNQLKECLEGIGLEKSSFNGGMYIAYFNGETKYYQVLSEIGKKKLNITYTRNISDSSRRFFVS